MYGYGDDVEAERHIQAMLPEQMMLTAIALGQQELQEHLQKLRPKQAQFLRMRAMTDSDSQARHNLGKLRKDGDPNYHRVCKCAERKPGWLDFREETVLAWKHEPTFMAAYNTLLQTPVMFAATHLEMLAPAAVQTLAEIMGGGHGAEASQMRLAAQQILQSTNLAQTPGSSGKPQAGTQQTMMDRVKQARAQREGRSIQASSVPVPRRLGHHGDRDAAHERMQGERGSDPSDYLIES